MDCPQGERQASHFGEGRQGHNPLSPEVGACAGPLADNRASPRKIRRASANQKPIEKFSIEKISSALFFLQFLVWLNFHDRRNLATLVFILQYKRLTWNYLGL